MTPDLSRAAAVATRVATAAKKAGECARLRRDSHSVVREAVREGTAREIARRVRGLRAAARKAARVLVSKRRA